MITADQIEALARTIHAQRVKYAPAYWNVGAFEGKERDDCVQMASEQLEKAERDAPILARLAVMSDAQIEESIELIDFEAATEYRTSIIASLKSERSHLVAEQLRRSVASSQSEAA